MRRPWNGLIAGGRINGEAQDFFGRACGDFFDVHAAFGRADKADAAGLAVHQQGQVEFGLNAGTVFDIDAVDLFACGAGLVRDQCAAQHLLGFLGGFGSTDLVRRTPPFSPASASLNLPLPRPPAWICALTTQRGPSNSPAADLRFFGAHHDAAIRDRCTKAAQKGFRLIFVDVHELEVPY